MTKERAAKIILDLINAGEAEYRNFSVKEIRALKKAYVALNPEPITNAERIRAMSDEELAHNLFLLKSSLIFRHEGSILAWLKAEAEEVKFDNVQIRRFSDDKL